MKYSIALTIFIQALAEEKYETINVEYKVCKRKQVKSLKLSTPAIVSYIKGSASKRGKTIIMCYLNCIKETFVQCFKNAITHLKLYI